MTKPKKKQKAYKVTRIYHWQGQKLVHEPEMERIVRGFLHAMGYQGKIPTLVCAYAKLGKYRGKKVGGLFRRGSFGKHGRNICMVLVKDTKDKKWLDLVDTLAHESVHLIMCLRGKKPGHGKWFKKYALQMGAIFP